MEDKKGKEFELLASPNDKGISAVIKLDSLPDSLKVTNGSNYTRQGSYLDSKYYLIKNYAKGTLDTHTDSQKSGVGKGKLDSVQLAGFKPGESKK